MEVVKTCRCLNGLKAVDTIMRCAKIKDALQALEILGEYFNSELGKEGYNIYAIFEEEGAKKFVNTDDEEELFPVLSMLLEQKAKEILKKESEIKQVLFWLNLFMEKWREGIYTKQQKEVELPEHIKQAFEKAIAEGWMQKKGSGYKWTFERCTKASLAYFVWTLHKKESVEWRIYEQIFNQKKLQQSCYQTASGKKELKWKTTIDSFCNHL